MQKFKFYPVYQESPYKTKIIAKDRAKFDFLPPFFTFFDKFHFFAISECKNFVSKTPKKLVKSSILVFRGIYIWKPHFYPHFHPFFDPFFESFNPHFRTPFTPIFTPIFTYFCPLFGIIHIYSWIQWKALISQLRTHFWPFADNSEHFLIYFLFLNWIPTIR